MPPWQKGGRTIQLPYCNRFETIWEYKKSFQSGEIDFPSAIGLTCPICGCPDCYRAITPYWRYAIDVFPEFRKSLVPIARFLCRNRLKTFSLLPIQLIPYYQYTVGAVMGTLMLAFGYWQVGQRGFWDASLEIDPDSLLTPWLITYWLKMIVRGLQRAHAVLGRIYDLSGVRTFGHAMAWETAASYFLALGWDPHTRWGPFLDRYSRATGQFFFGTPSQHRALL